MQERLRMAYLQNDSLRADFEDMKNQITDLQKRLTLEQS